MRRGYVVAALLVVALVPAAGATGGNEAPLANAGLDQDVEQGRTVVLDATGSTDPDGSIVAYDWTITAPDGSTMSPRCGSCSRTRFDADQVGRYEVTVEVTDGDGASSRDTLYVDVGVVSGPPARGGSGSGPPPGVGGGGPPDGVDVAAGPPGVGTAETVSTSRVSCTSEEVRLGHDCVGIDEPHVSISGPDYVAVGEDAGFSTETFNFEGSKSYGWSTGGGGPSTSASWTTPGTKTVVVSVRDEQDNTDVTQTWVHVVENEPPKVQIDAPSDFSPGEEISLSTSVKEDPDGEVVDTEWSPSSTITVPENDSVSVSITVTDDGGASATDEIRLTGQEQSAEDLAVGIKVFCYYTDERQRANGNPHHCEQPSATKPDRPDGYSSAPGGFNYYQNSDYYTILWKKVPPEELNANIEEEQPAGDPGDLNEEAYPTTAINPGRILEGETEASTDTSTLTPFSLNGKTVKSDLTDDGKIDAADWDQRYGLAEEDSDEIHENAVNDLKNTQNTRRVSDSGNSRSRRTDSGSSDNSESDPNMDSTDNSHQEAVDNYKNSQQSYNRKSSSGSWSGDSSSSDSSSHNRSRSSSSSSSSSGNSSSNSNSGNNSSSNLNTSTTISKSGGTGHSVHGF